MSILLSLVEKKQPNLTDDKRNIEGMEKTVLSSIAYVDLFCDHFKQISK